MTSCFSRTEHRHAVHATLLLTCAPKIWTWELASNSLVLNPVDYLIWRALQQMMYCHSRQQSIVSHKSLDIDQLAQTRANRLLDWAKPGHIEPSDQSAAKKTDDGYQGKVCLCWISCGVIFLCRWSLLLLSLHVRVKNWVKSMRFVKVSIISHVVKFYAN